MYSTLCITPGCGVQHITGSSTLLLYRCNDCKESYIYANENELRNMVAAVAIERRSSINFKSYTYITLHRYPELTKYITSLVQHPKTTMLKQAVFGSV